MSKIILTMDGLVLKEFLVAKERTTIGRKPHNDIQIDNLAVSGDHAVILKIQEDEFLEDLGSTNGTLVNGRPVTKHFLQDDDRIELGKYKLRYVKELPASTMQNGHLEKTMLLRTGANHAQTVMRDGSSSGFAAKPAHESRPIQGGHPVIPSASPETPVGSAALHILTGKSAGRALNIAKMLTTVGKVGIQVAVITRRPKGYFITHVEGEKFPSVNGILLNQQAHALSDQDVIEIAGVKMSFSLTR